MKRQVFTRISLAALVFLFCGSGKTMAQAGAALNFDGTNDIVNCGSAITGSLNGSTVLTAEAWIRPTTLIGGKNIVSNHQFAATQFAMRQFNSQLTIMLGFGTHTFITAPNTLTANIWQHVAMVFNGTSLTAYINGVNAGSVSFPSYSLNTSTDNVTLGSNAFNENFVGDLDEVRIWRAARSQSDIQSSMNCEIATVSANLLANYHFNQGTAASNNTGVTSLVDASGNSFNGTLTNFALTGTNSNWVAPGAVASGASCNGASLHFDGVNDIVNCGTAITGSLNASAVLTAEAWIRPSTVIGGKSIVSNHQSGTTQFALRQNGSSLDLMLGFGTQTLQTAPNTLTANVWQHVAMVFTGTTLTAYINGVNSGSVSFPSYSLNTSNNVVSIGSNAFSELFDGNIDEVRIWRAARSQADIQNSMNCEITGSSTNLLANYHFNQGIASGSNTAVTSLTDDSGNNFNGTLTNFSLTGSTSNWVATGGVASGFSCNGAALNFDGTNDVVNCGSAITTSLNLSNVLTAEAWIRPEVTTGGGSIVSNHQLANTQFALRRNGSSLNVMIGFGTYTVQSAPNTLTANVWQHVAMVFNGTTLIAYINGVNVGSTSFPSYSLVTSTDNIAIGSNGFSEPFDGSIDEVRIWRRALCQGEIQNNMNSQLTLPQTNLLGYYRFNQGLAACTNTDVTSLIALAGTTGTLQNFGLTTGTVSNWVTPGGVSSTSTVSAFVSPTLSVSGPTTICSSNIATLVASGVSSYTWTGGPTSASFAVSPSVTTTYSVVGTASNGCITNLATRSLSVNTSPTVGVNSGSICSGTSFTMVPSGAGSYTVQGTNTVVSPTTLTTYTVVGTSTAGCISVNTATSTVAVNAIPVVAASGGTICNGQSFTITPSGAASYTFTGGSAVVTPSSTSAFTVSGTSAAGCVGFTTTTVTVNSTPTIVVNSGSICAGKSFTILPTGANTYTIQGGTATVSPIANASYTVVGTSTAGCVSVNSATSSVTVNANPTVTASSGTICAGQSYTIAPGGALTYTFTGGSSIVNPSANTSYTVSGTNAVGCVGSAISNVTVNANPTLSVNSGTICAGATFTIVPAGANTYTIQGGSANVSPSSSTSYTIVGTSTAGCLSANTATSSVTVNANPTITANSGTICNGQSFTITAGGASTYTYSGGNAVVSPTATSAYTVTGTNTVGCTGSVVSNVTVNANPTVTAVSNLTTLCAGETASITASGAQTYSWNTNSTSTVITISPIATTNYTVVGTTNGCTSSFTLSQIVSQCTGIEARKEVDAFFTVYPNPSNGMFTISGNSISEITITDALGKTVYNKKVQSESDVINLSNLSNGLYFLIAECNGQLKTARLVKQ